MQYIELTCNAVTAISLTSLYAYIGLQICRKLFKSRQKKQRRPSTNGESS